MSHALEHDNARWQVRILVLGLCPTGCTYGSSLNSFTYKRRSVSTCQLQRATRPHTAASLYTTLNYQHLHPFTPLHFISFKMRSSFFALLAVAIAAVHAAPTPGGYTPPKPKGGNGGSAQTGNTGNVNGGDVINQGFGISNGYGASKSPQLKCGNLSADTMFFLQTRPAAVVSPGREMHSQGREATSVATAEMLRLATLAMPMAEMWSTAARSSPTLQDPVSTTFLLYFTSSVLSCFLLQTRPAMVVSPRAETPMLAMAHDLFMLDCGFRSIQGFMLGSYYALDATCIHRSI